MQLNLRQAIIQRVSNKSNEELYEVIEDSVDGDDRTLPGLGVLFEIIWHNSERSAKDHMIAALKQGLPH